MQQSARNEFTQALKALTQERGIEVDVILALLKDAYVAAYKKDAVERGEDIENFEFDAVIDSGSGEAKIVRFNPETPDAKEDVTPPGFGRIAAQTAKQVIHQKIREAEKDILLNEFEGKLGGLVSGVVIRFDGPNARIDLGRAEGVMPAEERVPTERLNPGTRMAFLLKSVDDTARRNIILSRSDPEFVKKVFAREVPEISTGAVEIKSIAREPGVRTKIAVFSSQSGVDPVGSCVGQKGVRVQAVTNELNGERIDIIPYLENDEEFLKATLAPVNVLSIKIDKKEKTALVVVADPELSLAIGREGQNVRLASKLTGYKIEIQGDGSGQDQIVEEEERSGDVVQDGEADQAN